MPLSLNSVETEREKCVVWDPESALERQDASDEIKQLQHSGFCVKSMNSDIGQALLTPPEIPWWGILFRVLSENGDDRLLWDRRDVDQIEEAKKRFDTYTKQGYTPYTCKKDGSKGSKLDNFDSTFEEIIFVPKTCPG